ncbi:MAG: DNA polymerase III subunit beta [Chlamydiales bacterium]|nr:DNA polymerase III subunit beta [Chlamydiales bacterium]
MKFVISRVELAGLLSKLQNVVSQKTTIPVLNNFLLEAANDELVLSATDLTVGLRCYTDTKVLEEGATTLPVKKFAALVRELTCANLEVTCNENSITEIIADSSRFRLHGMSKNEFPSLPDFEGAARFVIKQKTLKDMFNRTSFSVSREDNRYVLTGVLMQIANGVATFVGTDGKRLARAHVDLDIDKDFAGCYTLPLKAVDEIVKNLVDDEDETATVYLLEDRVAVEGNHVNLITKLLQGDYPDYNRVIPESSETVVTIHVPELTSLLRQVSLFTSDATHSVRFSFTDGELKLSANNAELGEGQVSMPVNYHGSKLEVAFNPQFFLDILRHCNNERITLGITDAYNPGVITDIDGPLEPGEQPSPLFVLMPMRLNET